MLLRTLLFMRASTPPSQTSTPPCGNMGLSNGTCGITSGWYRYRCASPPCKHVSLRPPRATVTADITSCARSRGDMPPPPDCVALQHLLPLCAVHGSDLQALAKVQTADGLEALSKVRLNGQGILSSEKHSMCVRVFVAGQ